MKTAITILWIVLKLFGWIIAGAFIFFALLVIVAFFVIPKEPTEYYHDHHDLDRDYEDSQL